MGERDALKVIPPLVEVEKYFTSSYIGVGRDRAISFMHVNNIARRIQKRVKKKECVMRSEGVIEEVEEIVGFLDE